ncbi:hypothetical protein [Pontimicrobium sp. MEBiC06410]
MAQEHSKIKIFQADDNDLKESNNKFNNVIDALLVFLNIDRKEFKTTLIDQRSFFDYKEALEKINKYIDYRTSSDIFESKNNLSKVKEILKKEKFHIYIIDLKWGDVSNAGLELIDIIKNKTNPNNIIIYTQHDKNNLNNFLKNKYDPNFNHITTEDIISELPLQLNNIVLNIRNVIFNNQQETYTDKIRIAINRNDYDFFKGKILYNGKSYCYKDLFFGKDRSLKNIFRRIKEELKPKVSAYTFPKSSHFHSIKETYVKTYVELNTNEKIFDLLDFGAINLFLKFYNISSHENYHDAEHLVTIKEELQNLYCPSTKKDLYDITNWKKFYKILVYRRLFLLWTKYFNDFNDIVKKNHFEENISKNKKPTKYGILSTIIEHGFSKITHVKPKKDYEKILIMKKLSFERDGDIIFTNLLSDEIDFHKSYSFPKLESYILEIRNINSERAKKYFSLTIKSEDLWDFKSMYFDTAIIDNNDTQKQFRTDIDLVFDELEMKNELKGIFYNPKIMSFDDLLSEAARLTNNR